MRTGLKVTALAAVATMAAACGSDGGGDSPAAAGGSGELTEVTVNIVPFTPNAVLFLAMENGTFERNGIKVNIERAASPVPVVASLVADQAQFGFVTTPVLINAAREGTALKCVSPVDGQISPTEDSSALVAAADSGIDSLDDLGGKSVAVVQLASINLIGAKKLIEDTGATGTEYVALPFPQMPQALADGRVDAAVITSPFLEQALDAGAVELAAPSSDLFPEGTVYCYAATSSYLGDNADVATRFQKAMQEAIVYAGEHQDEAKATLVEYLELTEEQAQAQVMPSNFVPEINLESIGEIQDLMQEQGSIDSTVDPAELVFQP
ncbi:ABC transporter substrate-binding protein [Modestobacter sp. VKM Ac-2986]|uniref:ABC transporter substrate-binding protein n=1 Tax=Modestobacter sp. VKM Ac-2986 TaxID=3004140 RepID=UPI0022AA5196|nr:ABC transporter substrate-binding protein [Modestobacter sp. VKM Ac-2986]MCZ2827563.1 ABC transporter substrate-binding protein [Modestobacter sp. VKM Ac-2986]